MMFDPNRFGEYEMDVDAAMPAPNAAVEPAQLNVEPALNVDALLESVEG